MCYCFEVYIYSKSSKCNTGRGFSQPAKVIKKLNQNHDIMIFTQSHQNAILEDDSVSKSLSKK